MNEAIWEKQFCCLDRLPERVAYLTPVREILHMKRCELQIKAAFVHQLFEAQVMRSPQAIAVEFADQQLTYQQLNHRANQLAHYLQAQGVRPDIIVGLCVERSIELIVAVLAILKAGGAYLPLDCSYPANHLNFMLENAQAPLLLTQSHLADRLPSAAQRICLDSDWPAIAQHSTANPDSDLTLDHLAYVIYTSGSTGKPKGVAMPHRPLVNLLLWQLQESAVGAGAKTLQFTPISFDVSFQEIFSTLAAGGTLVLISEQTRRDPIDLLQLLNHAGIERLFLPYVALQHLAEAATRTAIAPAQLREVITAGEQLRITSAIAHWFEQMPHCTLHNHYGPSESHVVTAFKLSGSPKDWATLPPIGHPIFQAEIHLLDADQRPVADGVAGELYIGGVSLARGYLNRPDLTAERFISHPQGRLYKTGDLARYLPNGAIEYLGRIDQQVKVRGFRIEPGEVEAVLEQHPAVRESVVIVREDRPGGRRLVAYAVLHPEAAYSTAAQQLREFLKTQLPEYMVPSAVVVLDQFPLTPSGKIDRRHLPVPNQRLDLEVALPQTQTEILLAEIWAQVLGLEQVGIEDNFLELGGHSLLATQIVSRIREALAIELPLRSLLEASTVSVLAKQVEALQQQKGTQIAAIEPAPRDIPLPLAHVQEPLWFLDQLAPNNPFYNVPEAFELKGHLDVSALEQCFQEIIDRHEVLRTSFIPIEGKPVQVIHPTPRFTLAVVDLNAAENHYSANLVPEAIDRENNLFGASSDRGLDCELIIQAARQPFDLSQDLLLRVTLFKQSETEHILLINLHHIVCDGWSISVLLQELAILYPAFVSKQASPLPALTIQYADFAVWHRQWLQGEQSGGLSERDRQLDYWQQQLRDLTPILLPTDYPRPPVSTYRGARHFFTLSEPLTQQLKSLSRGEGVTLFMTLLSAFQTLLFQYTGQDDIPVGSLVANRHRPELETMLGFFANTIVLRTDLSNSPTFRQLLQRVRAITLAAYAHQDLPFEQLVRVLQPDRDLNQNPLVQVVFNLQNTPASTWEVPGVSLTHLPLDNRTVKFDLFLELTETPAGLTGYFEYSTDLFAASSIARLAEHLQILLTGIVANPDQNLSEVCLLSATEQQQLHDWNQTQAEIPSECVHQLFEAQVERSPDAIAVEFDGHLLTYRELNQRANQFAHYLQSLGVKPNVVVGICVERSLELVIGLLAILKAGGAYVPLDPSYPAERLAFMLSDSQAPVLVTQQRLVSRLPEHDAQVVCMDADWAVVAACRQDNPESRVTHENLIYLLYTSGSTGQPKGVQLRHRGLVNLLHFMRQQPGLSDRDVCFAVSSISFDIAEVEIHLPLIVGARIFLVSREVAADAARLARTLEQSGATFMQATPASWQLLLAAGWQGNKNLKIVTCGEALNRTLADRLLERVYGLWNMYAPTETTIHSTLHKMELNTPVLVGRPIPNMQFYVLNAQGQEGVPKPVPIGVPGEVYIGGAGVAQGYLNRPELTAQKFVPNPFELASDNGDRLYRSGDLGRFRPDGNLEIIGRIDYQVKIRGFRIELGDVEAALSQHPAIREAAVVVREDKPGDKRLVAYVVPQGESEAPAKSHEQLQQWQTVWNEAYRQPSSQPDSAFDPTFNTITWNSSYTNLPIPAEQMQEWVDRTVERILSLQPQRVLEIGCGMGLLLFRIAPHCCHYFGMDLSQTAIDYIQQQLDHQPGLQVELAARSADALDGFAAEAFDTVIINSVIQYFPSVDYLVSVLENAVKLVKPGGQIFIGDVRSLPLLEAFHTSVQLHQAAAEWSIAQFRQRIQERMAQDGELVIDPAFFTALSQHLPQISHAQIQLKRGDHDNEMTRFRYDVVLQIGSQVEPAAEPTWLNWQPDLTVSAIRQRLQETQPQTLGLSQIKNARVVADRVAVKLLAQAEAEATVGEWRETLQRQQPAIHPEAWWSLSQDLPYTVHINWSELAEDCYDVVFQHRSAAVPIASAQNTLPLKPWHTYVHSGRSTKSSSPVQFRAFLQQKLPDYMVPAAFVVLDSLPRTPNGKVNRRSLPAPNRARPDLKAAFVASRNSIEERLVEIWEQVLGIDQVGVYDNFFELGGHSLLAAQVLARVQTAFQIEFSLLNIFLAPTVAGLAEIIGDRLNGTATSPLLNPCLDLEAEAVLDPEITAPAMKAKATAIAPVSAPANVLLTGATGFLGAFLLHELLEQTQANVYCLVRADNAPAARQRLQTNLEFYSLWHPDRSSRIIPVVGDLSQPLLGLSSEQFQTLAETIDAIYHNGGSVNFIYPYSVLKAANVLGTQEVLRLASRSQLKPVHFVSSLGVFSPIAYADGQVIREQDLPDRSAGLYGYTQSKWVAEKLIAIAQARGIPASIHRPAWIEGHSQTGICNRSDFLRSLIKGCIQLGLAPDWNMPIDIVPVDWISRAIVRLSQQNTSSGKVYNFSNPQAISWNQLVRWMCDWGYEIEQIPYQQWLEKVLDRVSLDRDHALHPFRAFLTEKIPEQQMSVPEIYFQTNSIRFDSQNVVKGLANTACTYPPIDDRLLSTYFSYLIHSGFLESPQAIAIPGTATTSG